MKVSVIGQGFVGLSLAVMLALKKISVYGVETNKSKFDNLRVGKSPFFEPGLDKLLLKAKNSGHLQFIDSVEKKFQDSDVFFITVPTPTKKGKIDLTYVTSIITSLGKLIATSSRRPVIIIKSTIAPGTTTNTIIPLLKKHSNKILGKDYFLVINPEFLREGTAIIDQKKPHVIVIGCEDNTSKTIMKNFYARIYPKKIPQIFTNYSTAELIKYSNNAFLATKISFINSISNLCQKIPGANVDEVAKVIGMDPRINPLYLKAGPGYGGSCLPKDLESFISVYENFGIQPLLFKGVKAVNDEQINQILSILEQRLKKITGKTISILGLSFKENSDDIRESRSILLIKKLLSSKCRIKVYDPLAIQQTRKVFHNKISYCNSISDCLKNSDCLIIMNQSPEFKKLNSDDFIQLKNPIVIDTRRVLQKIDNNIDYIALGINKK